MAKSSKIALTGATGHIGYALLKELLAQDEAVRILVRRDKGLFDEMNCEKVQGDVTDYESLVKAFEGVDTVYHLAGYIEIKKGYEDKVWQVNYDGTRNVVRACQECKVKKLVYMSSVDAVPVMPNGELMVEPSSFDPELVDGTYAKTKAAATQFVLDNQGVGGLDVVVVHPSACIGPYDFKVSSIGEMVRMFMGGKFPVSLGFGAYNFVDVRDVASGSILAAQRGRAGECYFLCGEAMSVDEFIKTLAKVCLVKAPRLRLGSGICSIAAPFAEIYYNISKTTPLFTRYSLRKLKENCNFSNVKAKTELGYEPMSVEQSLADMVEWIKENEGNEDD